MRIGILTFNRTINYGAILQCYALQNILHREGHEVSVINYKQPYIEIYSSLFSWKYVWIHRCHPGNIFRYIKNYNKRKNIYVKFRDFSKQFLNSTKPCSNKNIPKDSDIYIIGSDQLWTKDHTGGIFDKTFFGAFKRNNNSQVYSYAISCNNSSIESLLKRKDFEIYKNFKILSFREENASKRFSEELKVETRTDIDPTLLADERIWEPLINKEWSKKRYIAIYQARTINGYENEIERKATILAQKMNIEVINLSSYKYSPSDFVSIIKYAVCIFTSSFHGLAFSLVFNKPFYVFSLNDGHDGRCLDLLNKLGIADNVVSIKFQVDGIKHINYDKINIELEKLREHSISYIRDMLK